MSVIGPGRVKTTWKYGTGKSSAWRSASHSLAAAAWHFGQCRSRQVMGVAHYLPYGEQLVMGSWRRAERLIRCEINRFSLRRGRSSLHNIRGPSPYCTPNGKTQTVDFAVLSHLGRGYFRPIRQRIAWLWPIRNGEHMRAGSLRGRDGAFASSPLPIAPHKTRVVSDAA